MAEKNEKEKAVNEQIRDFGQVELEHGEDRIFMLTIIGEIEGHECLPAATKTTKYEHVLPKLAEVEENKNVDGLLLLLNTVGGDVEAGLALAELIASVSKPSATLVLGGGHSIGTRWQPFHRRAAGSLHGLFFYRAIRYDGDPPGADEWNCDRGAANV